MILDTRDGLTRITFTHYSIGPQVVGPSHGILGDINLHKKSVDTTTTEQQQQPHTRTYTHTYMHTHKLNGQTHLGHLRSTS